MRSFLHPGNLLGRPPAAAVAASRAQVDQPIGLRDGEGLTGSGQLEFHLQNLGATVYAVSFEAAQVDVGEKLHL